MPPRILISGAGIAGPVLAWYLSQAGISSTIIERSPSARKTGQQIDIRGLGLEIVNRMNLMDSIRAATVKEDGIAFVDSQGKTKAYFGVNGGNSFTSEIEILRGDLARVFYESTKDCEGIEYRFGDFVVGIEELGDGSGAKVRFESGMEEVFDVIVAADGMMSRTRRVVWNEGKGGSNSPIKSLSQHICYFTMPLAPEDKNYASWGNAPGRRLILIRPDQERNRVGGHLGIMSCEAFKDCMSMSQEEQKRTWAELFKDAGGLSKRVVEGMLASDDFYMQETAQVKMPQWSKGRVVLLGDAGYCPSPITGMGTTLALLGAYTLAGELAEAGDDWKGAFEEYEAKMRPQVEKAQTLAPGAPWIMNPETKWGIGFMHAVLGFVSWSGLANWLQGSLLSETRREELPVYEKLPGKVKA